MVEPQNPPEQVGHGVHDLGPQLDIDHNRFLRHGQITAIPPTNVNGQPGVLCGFNLPVVGYGHGAASIECGDPGIQQCTGVGGDTGLVDPADDAGRPV